jgi:imidazolonepropionase-like amidohydrolase
LGLCSCIQKSHPQGPLGLIKEGAYSDIRIVDDDPTKDIRLLADADNKALITKAGKIYKIELSSRAQQN